jgi:hypothetical protein
LRQIGTSGRLLPLQGFKVRGCQPQLVLGSAIIEQIARLLRKFLVSGSFPAVVCGDFAIISGHGYDLSPWAGFFAGRVGRVVLTARPSGLHEGEDSLKASAASIAGA